MLRTRVPHTFAGRARTPAAHTSAHTPPRTCSDVEVRAPHTLRAHVRTHNLRHARRSGVCRYAHTPNRSPHFDPYPLPARTAKYPLPPIPKPGAQP